jgi:hypothetical protein
VCIYEKGRAGNTGKYFIYSSHSDETWPPSETEVV